MEKVRLDMVYLIYNQFSIKADNTMELPPIPHDLLYGLIAVYIVMTSSMIIQKFYYSTGRICKNYTEAKVIECLEVIRDNRYYKLTVEFYHDNEKISSQCYFLSRRRYDPGDAIEIAFYKRNPYMCYDKNHSYKRRLGHMINTFERSRYDRIF